MKLEWLEWDRIARLVQSLPEATGRLTLWERTGGRERMVAEQHIDDATLLACLELHGDAESERVLSVPESAGSAPPLEAKGRGRRKGGSRTAGAAQVQRRAGAHPAQGGGPEAGPTDHGDARQPGVAAAAWRGRAITHWLRTSALRCVREDMELIGFRLRAHGRGSRPLASACFSICNLTWIPADEDIPLHQRSNESTGAYSVDQPAANAQGPQEHLAGYVLPPELAPGEAYHALGRYYAQTGQMWLEGYQSILAVHTTLLQDTLERLLRSRELEDTLRAEVVRLHLDHLERTLAREPEPRDTAMRDALVLQVLAALQDVARAARASQMEAARVAEVRALLDAAPGVVMLLQDPAVQWLLRDPRHVPLLAEMLRSLAAQLADRQGGP